ncbi:hypothetical protein LCE32_36785, partial [Streptomyces sp. 7G]|nr:hypothetical protein [Streptomyces sp. 7G]
MAPAPAPRNRLFRHPHSQVLDWVRANPDDPRRPVIESRIAERPAAVWFAAHNPGEIAGQVRAVTRGGGGAAGGGGGGGGGRGNQPHTGRGAGGG